MQQYLIPYVITSVIFETIYAYILWKNFKKKMDTEEQYEGIKYLYKNIFCEVMKPMLKGKVKILAYFIMGLSWICICPWLFPITLAYNFRKYFMLKWIVKRELRRSGEPMHDNATHPDKNIKQGESPVPNGGNVNHWSSDPPDSASSNSDN